MFKAANAENFGQVPLNRAVMFRQRWILQGNGLMQEALYFRLQNIFPFFQKIVLFLYNMCLF